MRNSFVAMNETNYLSIRGLRIRCNACDDFLEPEVESVPEILPLYIHGSWSFVNSMPKEIVSTKHLLTSI